MNVVIALILSVTYVACQKDPHFAPNRTTIVHLFEWKWQDIAKECETFLKDRGYGGVQISPPNENLVVSNRPWWERYQPVSYKLDTRSGNETEFKDMVKRCNTAGVRIYADVVINDMAAMDGVGTAGSESNSSQKSFPAVPYTSDDFNPSCEIKDYNNATNVRDCELLGLKDLNQTHQHVREKILEYMNHLIDCGVAGFRIDSAKHMWPSDLADIFGNLSNLNAEHGFEDGAKPFIYQEVIDLGGEAIKSSDYIEIGRVLEFKYGNSLGSVITHSNANMSALDNWGEGWGMLNSGDAVAFIDNHDNQRSDNSNILTYKKPKPYKLAIAFMLAHPYGVTRIISSYDFDDNDQPPPHDGDEILSPGFTENGTCTNGWVCEHRWRQIFGMVGFRDAVNGTSLTNWWSNDDNQVAFCRGNKGFAAFNNGGNLNSTLQVCVPAGKYCDVISGELRDGECTGKVVEVDSDSKALITISEDEDDSVLAIHVNSKL